MKSSNDIESIKDKFNALLTEQNEQEGIEHDAYMLMSAYLSEVERLSRIYGYNRKELAKNIKISASYLTQIFRGDKPLNFQTIAKIQRALRIRFHVTADTVGASSQSTPLPIVMPEFDVQKFPVRAEQEPFSFVRGGLQYSGNYTVPDDKIVVNG